MVAKLAGIGLVVWGAVLAFTLVVFVLGSFFAAAVLASTGLIAAGLSYVGLRWVRGEGTQGKVLGMLSILAGLAVGFEALSSAVVGFFGALLLAVKILVVSAMCYIGWSWFQQGSFSLLLGRMRP
ncbi:MAG: hypothetical protein VX792_06100 [Candidatus Latescibacterota bacterium]|nr:hypothetical protein [Candidatus Latescibacterota bacterium]